MRARTSRKPWGHGKAALQKNRRNMLACEIAGKLLRRLDVEHVQLTGELIPRGTLKSSKTKRLFSWVHRFRGRVFTSALVKMVIRKLLRLIGNVPINPNQTYGSYVSGQSKRLGKLARRAKKLKHIEEGFKNIFK